MKTDTPTEILPGAVYTQQETMEFLRISWEAFNGVIQRHEIRFSFVGRRRRFYGQDILDYVKGERPVQDNKKIPENELKQNKRKANHKIGDATTQAIQSLKAIGAMK